MKWFLQRVLQDFMKKKILGRSNALWTSRGPSEPAYYIVD